MARFSPYLIKAGVRPRSLWEGVLSIFYPKSLDFTIPSRAYRDPFEADREALAQDWKNIGADLMKAMLQYEEEHGRGKEN